MMLAFAAAVLAAAGAPATAPQDARQQRFSDAIEVRQVIVDARVVDWGGHPIPGLGPGAFRVLVDGEPVELLAADWIGAGDRPAPPPVAPGRAAGAASGESPAAPPGRLVVFFFQKDFHVSRLTGLIRMAHKGVEFLDRLGPADRVAVVSHDSHLRLWLDFTADRERLRRTILHDILFERDGTVPANPEPSLASRFDYRAAADAANSERALGVLADALDHLPGPKSVVMFGWGAGRFHFPDVLMDHRYPEIVAALAAARVTVFTLDITDADYHTLQVGLKQVAHDTGGFYVKTHLFPDIALRKLEDALSGHYELVFERPAGPPGAHEVRVELVGVDRADVQFRPFYEDPA